MEALMLKIKRVQPQLITWKGENVGKELQAWNFCATFKLQSSAQDSGPRTGEKSTYQSTGRLAAPVSTPHPPLTQTAERLISGLLFDLL